MPLSEVLRQLTQIFLTVPCPLCQRSAVSVLCSDCNRQLQACQWSSFSQNTSIRGPEADANGIGDAEPSLSVFSWGQYRGVLKQSLAQLKYGNQAELGIWLGRQLGQHWLLSQPGLDRRRPIVIPIPLHEQRLKQRGYNQAALIAQGFCRVTGLPMAKDGLVRTKATTAMYSLGAKARQADVAGAFQLGADLGPVSKRRPILLIDDIYTTGSTAAAAAIPLRQAGYAITGIATVARSVFLSSAVD